MVFITFIGTRFIIAFGFIYSLITYHITIQLTFFNLMNMVAEFRRIKGNHVMSAEEMAPRAKWTEESTKLFLEQLRIARAAAPCYVHRAGRDVAGGAGCNGRQRK